MIISVSEAVTGIERSCCAVELQYLGTVPSWYYQRYPHRFVLFPTYVTLACHLTLAHEHVPPVEGLLGQQHQCHHRWVISQELTNEEGNMIKNQPLNRRQQRIRRRLTSCLWIAIVFRSGWSLLRFMICYLDLWMLDTRC